MTFDGEHDRGSANTIEDRHAACVFGQSFDAECLALRTCRDKSIERKDKRNYWKQLLIKERSIYKRRNKVGINQDPMTRLP